MPAKPALLLSPGKSDGRLLRVPRAPAVFSNVTLGFDTFFAEVGPWWRSGSSSGSGSSWMSPRSA